MPSLNGWQYHDMATIKVINSSSDGNTILLQVKDETLILDLGCNWKDIIKSLDYDLSKVAACLVTHVHIDHSRSIHNAIKKQLNVFSNSNVADKFDGVTAMQPKKKYVVGGFDIIALEVPHNVPNFAFVVRHDEFGTLLYATDLTSFKYRIKGIKTIILEANYSDDMIIENLCNDKRIMSMNDNHMEIGSAISAIRNNYWSGLDNVILCHLSSTQGDKVLFKNRVYDELGIRCEIAERGTIIDLNKEDF